MTNSSPSQLEILYSDRDIIAINKPAGLLSVGTTKETQQHALAILRNQLSHRSQAVKLWPVNQIDRDTPGVLLFATSREIRAHLSWLGYPVVGDPRYGTAGNRMGLHALRLKIVSPKTGKELIFETPAPADFFALMIKQR